MQGAQRASLKFSLEQSLVDDKVECSVTKLIFAGDGTPHAFPFGDLLPVHCKFYNVWSIKSKMFKIKIKWKDTCLLEIEFTLLLLRGHPMTNKFVWRWSEVYFF